MLAVFAVTTPVGATQALIHHLLPSKSVRAIRQWRVAPSPLCRELANPLTARARGSGTVDYRMVRCDQYLVVDAAKPVDVIVFTA